MDDAIRGDVDDLDELCTRKFTGAPRWEVIWIAGQPERVESPLASQRQQQTCRTRCVTVTAMGRIDGVADVPGVAFDVRARAETEVDFSYALS